MKLADTLHLGHTAPHGTVKFYDLQSAFSLRGITAAVASLFGLQVGHVANALTADFDVVTDGYYEHNPAGHWGVMLRAAPWDVTAAGHYSGHGPIFWALNRQGVPPTPAEIEHARWTEMPLEGPVAQIQEWDDIEGNRFLHPRSVSKRLADGVQYKVHAASVQDITGNRYVGYSLKTYNPAKNAYDALYATGDVLSNVGGIDMMSQRIAFFDASAPGPGTIRITNLHASYMTADRAHADLTAA